MIWSTSFFGDLRWPSKQSTSRCRDERQGGFFHGLISSIINNFFNLEVTKGVYQFSLAPWEDLFSIYLAFLYLLPIVLLCIYCLHLFAWICEYYMHVFFMLTQYVDMILGTKYWNWFNVGLILHYKHFNMG